MSSREVWRPTRRTSLGLLAVVPPFAARASFSNDGGKETGSSEPAIGNLFPTVQAYVNQRRSSYSFDPARWASLDEWRKETRRKCADYLAYEPSRVPLSARTLTAEQRDGYVQEEITFRSSEDVEVPASLLIPKRAGRGF